MKKSKKQLFLEPLYFYIKRCELLTKLCFFDFFDFYEKSK